MYLAPLLKVFHLELGIGTQGQKKTRMMVLPGRGTNMTLSSTI